jgi:serine/threonine-protein kinase HipA
LTFQGLPGLLADSLPDKFGNSIIDAWLARNGRDAFSFGTVERLCYMGKRGMGALEFRPPFNHKFDRSVPVEIEELVKLTQNIMQEREKLQVEFSRHDQDNAEALTDILRIGTSAGGARPKAVIAMNAEGKVISGQIQAPDGFDYWLLKFDGVDDLELGKPKEYGRIEFAYYLMAQAAGIKMMESRLLEENGRAHFLTKRFDRIQHQKIHMQSLCGLAHYDYNLAGAYSYEQALNVMHKLHLTKDEIVEQYRRMIFNILARNQDDHTKNIAFLMDQMGVWKLSPAFDITYSHNPKGRWTNLHQMTLNGKRDHFSQEDFLMVAKNMGIHHPEKIIVEVKEAIKRWPDFSKEAGISLEKMREIQDQHRK